MSEGPVVIPSEEPERRREASIAELVRSLLSDVSLLVRKEAELAAIEVKGKASKLGAAAALLAAAVVVALLGAATFVAAAVIALAIVLPAWASALIVAVVLFAVAAVLFVVGRGRVRDAGPPVPTETLDTVREDIGWMRHKTEQLTTTVE